MIPKKLFLMIIAWGLIIIVPFSASAQKKPPSLIEFRMSNWFSFADASWQIFFPGSSGTMESELNYDGIDSGIICLEGRWNPNVDFSLGLNLGFGDISDASFTDTDSTNGWTWSESQGDVDGEVRQWGINLFAHLLAEKQIKKNRFDIFVGYQHYEDKLRMSNGRQTVSNPGAPISLPKVGASIRNLNSTYDFEWNYLQAGVQTGYSLISGSEPALHSLEIAASLGVIPFLDFQGTGIWNLRSDFSQSPSFKHEAKSGYGFDASLALNYNPNQVMGFVLGYRYFYLNARDGTDTTYFADGATATADLNEVQVTRYGPYISIIVHF